MTFQNRRMRFPALSAILAALAATFGGCATQSERDEYNFVRGVKVPPSEISSADDAFVPIVLQTDFRTPRWADATRLGVRETELGTR